MGGNELFITLPYTEFQSTHPVWDGTKGLLDGLG